MPRMSRTEQPNREPSALVRVGGVVPVELADALAALAAENDRSVAAELRLAIRDHLDRATPTFRVSTTSGREKA